MLSALQKLQWWKKPELINPDQHLLDADSQIQTLLSDTSIPAAIKQELFREFAEIESPPKRERFVCQILIGQKKGGKDDKIKNS